MDTFTFTTPSGDVLQLKWQPKHRKGRDWFEAGWTFDHPHGIYFAEYRRPEVLAQRISGLAPYKEARRAHP